MKSNTVLDTRLIVKYILLLFIICCNTFAVAQKPNGIALKIEEAIQSQQKFTKVDIFENIQLGLPLTLTENSSMSELVHLNLSQEGIRNLFISKPAGINLSLPLPDGTYQDLLLQRVYLYEDAATLTTESDKLGIPLSQGIFYQGIIQNDPESIAAISFYEQEVIGVVSNHKYGNIVIGKKQGIIENNHSHVVYQESSLPVNNPFQCAIDDLHHDASHSNAISNSFESTFPNSCKAVKIFLECDYRMYSDRGNSKSQVEIFITGAFNVVKALYAAEKVVLEISEIKVWTTQDPYLKTTLANILFDYGNRVKNNFNGTLAQLITTFPIQQQGGIAFVDGMCRTWDPNMGGPHSFAFIFGNYSSLPTYSWIVEVMAHELGHNFGSWHTHSCVWGPNKNSQIDNCQPADIGNCNDGKTPVGGGTVMSYCHLTGIGINFSKGFGLEPGEVLRNAIVNKSCIPASFTPFTSKIIRNPYYEGDSIRLQARPYNNKYQYEWLHHDYIFNKKDTAVTIKNSGIYTLAVSNVNCTEYAKPDTININDFIVNLGCPVIKGFRDSIVREVKLEVDNAAYSTDSLEFPSGLYQQVPKGAIDVLVELQMVVAAKSTSFVRSVISQYESPDTLKIKNDNFIPNENFPFSTRTGSFKRILGNFDPAGKWKFSGIDTRSDAQGFDATVTYKIVISWRNRDSVATCDILFCDNKPRLLDSGIPNAVYKWSNGSTLKIVNVNTEGPIGVTVTRGSFSSTHTVNMVKVNTSFSQNLTLCEGKKLTIGNKQYDKSGTYIDTLKQTNGCDSLITTVLNFIPRVYTSDTIFKCFNDVYKNIKLTKDIYIIDTMSGFSTCDSIHNRFIRVNPEIQLTSNYDKKCNNIGTDLIINASGGKGSLKFIWSDSSTTSGLTGIKSGTYSVTVSDDGNCQLTKSIIVENYDSVSVKPSIQEVKCFGEKTGSIEIEVLSGKSPFTINWNTGTQGYKVENLSTGKYTAIVIDDNGCRFEKVYEVISPDLLFVDASVSPSFGNNGSILLNVVGGRNPYLYKWSNNDTTQNIMDLIPGTYTVSVTDNNGCTNIQTFEVQNKVGVTDLNKEVKIKITPNPFKDELFIQSMNGNIDNVKIIDLHGKTIIEKKSILDERIRIPTEELNSAYYIAVIQFANGNVIRSGITKL
ncbi:MAG: T9SS type A sorting domain-containing protein [Saprospiraceae bacterium]|nr:T9SS type A sorting domain-containing protein [Saprospiraceae bacterium]